jgi:DNA-binding NarL/FixJ family response regulator
MEVAKILLVDDHDVVRTGIKALLQGEENLKVVGEASNGKNALEFLDNQEVDLVVMDINMPVMDGIKCTIELKKKFPDMKVLALTMLSEEQHIRQMLKAGASGYILKNSGQQELLKAISSILGGQHYFSKEATQAIMMDMVNDEPKENKIKYDNIYLTDREKDVLKLIVKEFTNQEIADKLFISVRTVDAHRRNLLQKIGARNAAGLAIYAMNNNLLES